MKQIFKPENFNKIFADIMREGYKARNACDMWQSEKGPEDISNFVNEKLNELFQSWPVVFSKYHGPSATHSWNDNKNTIYSGEATHVARLAFIEEIKKAPCNHDPVRTKWLNEVDWKDSFSCRICGVEMLATWSEKK